MTIEERILLYPELTEEEQLEVRSYVEGHPEWKSLLDDAVAIDQVLRGAGSFDASDQRDEALAFFAASRNLPHTTPELDLHFGRVRERLESDPELKQRFDELESRRKELDRLSPAGEQYRRLAERNPPARSPEPGNVRYLWRAAAAVVALAALYSVLYKIGGMTQPETARLARFDREELVVEGFEAVRRGGASGEEASATAEYLAALDDLSQAERSFIGLFPRFDRARLDAASAHLQRVLDLEPEGSFLAGEAAYLLGKVHLARGELNEAEARFKGVVGEQSRRAEEAAAILQKLQGERVKSNE